jgi:deoxyadenosine/deoxycytidine kinase
MSTEIDHNMGLVGNKSDDSSISSCTSDAHLVVRSPNPPSPPLVVFIEGSVGVGKSTIGKECVNRLNAEGLSVIFVPEPDFETSGALRDMYNGKLPAGVFQVGAVSMRASVIFDALFKRTSDTVAIVVERSIHSDLVFARLNLTPDSAEWRLYEMQWNHIASALRDSIVPLTVLLDAPISLLEQRIAFRGRPSECQKEIGLTATDADEKAACVGGICTEYLEKLATGHEHLFNGIKHNKFRIDATASIDIVTARLSEVIRGALNVFPCSSSESNYDECMDRLDEDVKTSQCPRYKYEKNFTYGWNRMASTFARKE